MWLATVKSLLQRFKQIHRFAKMHKLSYSVSFCSQQENFHNFYLTILLFSSQKPAKMADILTQFNDEMQSEDNRQSSQTRLVQNTVIPVSILESH